ncbi:MAG: glycosyltransferase family 2 protein [Burkholderiales bacterium]|nr:glycosyltransferase family 2 protein [Burkholderiales bacterium]
MPARSAHDAAPVEEGGGHDAWVGQAAPYAPRVSVIVVNYNGLRFLPGFFESMTRAFERHVFELIVVDNHSTDGSVAWLRTHTQHFGFRLFALQQNTGFTGGNNFGAAWARGEVLLLINNDTAWSQPLDALVDAAMEPGVGAVGCQLRYGDGRLQTSIGLEHTAPRIVLSWLGLEKRPGAPPLLRKFETGPEVYANPQETVAWVSGACFATRADVWQRLRGLDADLFMYCEDVDYGRRVRAHGWRVAYLASPVVTHFEGGGKAWVGPDALLRTVRSYYIVTAKASGRSAARAVSIALAGVFAMRAVVFSALALGSKLPGPRGVRETKAAAYRRAAGCLGWAAWSGRTPPLV